MYRWYHAKILFQFIRILLVKGDEILRACDRHSNETVTSGKNVTKYKPMQKWIVEFLSKSESRDIKIVRVNSIRITRLSIIFNFLLVVPLCDVIKRTRFLMMPPVIIPPSLLLLTLDIVHSSAPFYYFIQLNLQK